ncbi:MAG: PAS domain-containing sensor histidine kinase [Planctomycetota bacterium]
MTTRRVLAPLGLLLLATAATWLWQWGDYRSQVSAERAADDRYGEGILAAAEGAMNQQCILSPTDTGFLRRILEDVRERVGATALGVYRPDGSPFVVVSDGSQDPAAGREPARSLERRVRRYRLPPHQQLCKDVIDSGLCRECGYPGAELEIRLEYPSDRLEARLERGRLRFLSVSGALSLTFLCLFLLYAGHLRASDLRAELLASAERVRSLEYLGRVAAGFAHETKNPLGSVRGFAEMLHRGELPEAEVRDAAARVVEEADRLANRVDAFLLLSRPAGIEKRPFSLKPLLEELAALVRLELACKEATIGIEGPEVTIEGDPEQARRLFLNLLVNAAEALRVGGRIDVRIAATRAGHRVEVRDDGRGVPEEIRESLFEPYVSARPGGTGLGLAIARRIASEHGWRIRHQPLAEGGTGMIVEVPGRG